jgi:hypothetical protein
MKTWLKRVMTNGQNIWLYADYMYYGTATSAGTGGKSVLIWKKVASIGSEVKIAASKAEDLFVSIT